MNAGLIILRVATLGRDAQNARDGAAILRSSVAAATPSQQRLRRSSVAAALCRSKTRFAKNRGTHTMTQLLLFNTFISLKSLGHSPAQKKFFFFGF